MNNLEYRGILTGYKWGEVVCSHCSHKQMARLNHKRQTCNAFKQKFLRKIDPLENIKYEYKGLYTITTNLNRIGMIIKKPTECSAEELKLFMDLVIKGGQVDADGLEKRIEKCKLLGFIYNEQNQRVGISAIKTKGKQSVSAVKAKAEVSDKSIAKYELGYSVKLAERKHPIFSIHYFQEKFREDHLN